MLGKINDRGLSKPTRIILITLIFLSFYGGIMKRINAAEIRMLTEMPTANKTTTKDLVKSKKAGWKCNKVKLSDSSGNAVNVKGSKPRWYSEIPSDQDDAAESLIADGKSAVKCVLQARIDGKMRNAESDSTTND